MCINTGSIAKNYCISPKSLFCIITSFDGGEACFTESVPGNIKTDRNGK